MSPRRGTLWRHDFCVSVTPPPAQADFPEVPKEMALMIAQGIAKAVEDGKLTAEKLKELHTSFEATSGKGAWVPARPNATRGRAVCVFVLSAPFVLALCHGF